jgi:predicted Na+-dependent transporter
MANRSLGTYILLAWIIVPLVTMFTLVGLSSALANWWELIGPVFLVYLVGFFVSIVLKKTFNRKVGNAKKAIIFVFVKTLLFTFTIIVSIFKLFSGGDSPVSVEWPWIVMNGVYVIVLISTWIAMATLNEWAIK